MKKDVFIRDLYPGLSEEELKEAEQKIDQYVLLILSIFERLEKQKAAANKLP